MKRVAIRSIGCKLNTHEGEILKELLREEFRLVRWSEVADYYVLNTCTVTVKADARARNYIRNAHRRNPDAKIVVTGCYAQTRSEDLERLPEASLILGNREKDRIPEFLRRLESGESPERVQVSNIWQERLLDVPIIRDYPTLARPFVKIQDGCNEMCSYCKIPMARGRNRSSPPERILEQVRILLEAGYREIVFSGVHMGCWGEDLAPSRSLEDLLTSVVALPGEFRVRLSSIEPNHISDSLVDFLTENPKVCRHFHIPLQSGDDEVLARMRRRYTTREYARVIERIEERMPGVCLGADVIAGFPGETTAQFENTLRFLRDQPLAYLHVFPYSRREGTPASRLPGQISDEIRTERARILRDESLSTWRAYVSGFLGQTLDAVIIDEKEFEEERCPKTFPTNSKRCLTGNFIDVLIAGKTPPRREFVRVRLSGLTAGEFAYGQIITNDDENPSPP